VLTSAVRKVVKYSHWGMIGSVQNEKKMGRR
jgi:hypothetical protein